jgi:hypothetical protein
MSEGVKKGVRKLTKKERQDMVQRLNDLQKRSLIDYDNYLVKDENGKLKQELQVRRRIKQIEAQMKSASKSKLKGSRLFKTEVPDAFLAKSASMSSGVFQSQMNSSQHQKSALLGAKTTNELHASSMLQEPQGTESLPEIRRKGTSYHRKFLKEVRSRDYKTYLNSLHAVKDYRQSEMENAKLKQRLLRTKMSHQITEFKNKSKQAWQKVEVLINEKDDKGNTKAMANESQVLHSEKTGVNKKKGEQANTAGGNKPATQANPQEATKPPAQNKQPAENKPAENPVKPTQPTATNTAGKTDPTKTNTAANNENF